MIFELSSPSPGDIGWLISEHGKLYNEEFGLDIEFEWDIAQKLMAYRDRQNGFDKIFIARVDNIRAASIAVMEKPGNKAFINFLLVKKEFRRKGIAEKLLNHVIDYAKSGSKESISLETYSILENARKMYREKGFSVISSKRTEKYGGFFDKEFWELKF